MKIELSTMEARVIGCLIEKQITTPDQYPLSLNALVNACNQKSNRDPPMDVDEATVQATLDGLGKKHFVMEKSGFGSRVPKYQHRFCNTEFGTLRFTPQELAIVCELLLRGPQTPGELRTRASRMAPLTDVSEVETALDGLQKRDDGPFVVRLPREPNRRDSRYAHLFGGPVAAAVASDAPARVSVDILRAEGAPLSAQTPAPAASAVRFTSVASSTSVAPLGAVSPDAATQARIDRLEAEIRQLRAELDDLKQRLGA